MTSLPPEVGLDEWVQLAREQMASGNATVSARILRRVLSIDPDHGPAHALLALALLDMNQLKSALHEAQLAVQCDLENAFAHLVLGVVLKELGRYAQAEVALQQAVQLDPEYATPYTHLADLAGRQSRWSQAAAYARQALALNPNSTSAMAVLANALCFSGKLDEAELVVRNALRQNPEDAELHTALARIALQRRQWRRAWQHALDALAIEPTHEEAQEALVQAAGIRSPLMRPAIATHLWLMRLPTTWRIATIVLFYMLMRSLRFIVNAPTNPALSSVIVAVALFMALFWLYLVLVPPLFYGWLRRARDRRLREAARQRDDEL